MKDVDDYIIYSIFLIIGQITTVKPGLWYFWIIFIVRKKVYFVEVNVEKVSLFFCTKSLKTYSFSQIIIMVEIKSNLKKDETLLSIQQNSNKMFEIVS